jgi:hypothetical protein
MRPRGTRSVDSCVLLALSVHFLVEAIEKRVTVLPPWVVIVSASLPRFPEICAALIDYGDGNERNPRSD